MKLEYLAKKSREVQLGCTVCVLLEGRQVSCLKAHQPVEKLAASIGSVGKGSFFPSACLILPGFVPDHKLDNLG